MIKNSCEHLFSPETDFAICFRKFNHISEFYKLKAFFDYNFASFRNLWTDRGLCTVLRLLDDSSPNEVFHAYWLFLPNYISVEPL